MTKEKIFNKKITDYTFSVLFFLFFSFSIFFIIRPTLSTLFSLKKQAQDLELINQIYDGKIIIFSNLQQFLENNRDKIPYLNEAIPEKPNLSKIIDDLDKVSSESGFTFKKINTAEISLKAAKDKKYNTAVFDIEGVSDFDQMMSFLEGLLNQRRLKLPEKILVERNKESSFSGQLKIKMRIKAGFL